MKTFFYIFILLIFNTCDDNPSTQNNDNDNQINNYFIVDIEETGESTLFIFKDTISSLDINDEIGLFDIGGFIDNQGNIGSILVGSGIWNGTQLEIVAIMAIDLSDFGGPIQPGALSGNNLALRIWDKSEEIQYEATFVTENGSGTFNGLFTAVSEITQE